MLTKIRKYQINLQLISLYPGSPLLTRLFKTFIHYIRNVVVFFPNACYRSYCEQYVLVRLSETISVFSVRPVWWRTSARTPVRRPSPSCTSSSLARVPRVTASTRLAWPTSRRKSSRAAIRRPASLRGAPCLSGYSGVTLRSVFWLDRSGFLHCDIFNKYFSHQYDQNLFILESLFDFLFTCNIVAYVFMKMLPCIILNAGFLYGLKGF